MAIQNGISTDASSIREHNLSQVLHLLHKNGCSSRSAIVHETGLSATTVSALVNILIDSGIVGEAGEGQSSGGRPPILLEFNYRFRYALGIDMGATHIATIVMDLNGNVIAREQAWFDVQNDPDGAMTLIQKHVASVMRSSNLEFSQLLGIGISGAAPLEGENLDRLARLIFPAWENREPRREIEALYHVPTYYDNDANLGAMAEKWWGSGVDADNLVYIKLGTGVGSGLIFNGEIFRGAGGTAGEIGHTTIDPDGPLCRCGNIGCLESYVGHPALMDEIVRKTNNHQTNDPSDRHLIIEKVALEAKNGNPKSKEIVQKAGTYIGIAIANLLNLVNPELILLGGELTLGDDVFLDAVRSAALERAITKAGREAIIGISGFKNDVVAIGAATLAIFHAFQPSNLIKTINF